MPHLSFPAYFKFEHALHDTAVTSDLYLKRYLVLCQQLLFDVAGQDPAAPSPTEAATNTKHTSDLLRRFKELTVKEPKDPGALDQPEVDLRVSFHLKKADMVVPFLHFV